MANGNIMQKMAGESIRIRIKGIDMLDNGRKIENGGTGERTHLNGSMMVNMLLIEEKVSEYTCKKVGVGKLIGKMIKNMDRGS